MKRVEILTKIGHDPRHEAGAVVEVPDSVADDWSLRGLAKETSAKVKAPAPPAPPPEPKEEITQVVKRASAPPHKKGKR